MTKERPTYVAPPVSIIPNIDSISPRSKAENVMQELKPTTQEARILRHLLAVGPITQLVALELYRCHRLASRVSALRAMGVPIMSSRRNDPTGVSFHEYSIVPN